MLRVGILLAGCGADDGTDPLEAACAALALDRLGLRAAWLTPEGCERESARLAHGPLETIGAPAVAGLAALVVPGGTGVVRSLLTGALVPGRRAELAPEVAGPLAALRARGAPLGAIGLGIEVLTRLEPGTTFDVLATPPRVARLDEARRIAWAPGFLGTDRPADAAAGIDEMVKALARWLGRPAALPR